MPCGTLLAQALHPDALCCETRTADGHVGALIVHCKQQVLSAAQDPLLQAELEGSHFNCAGHCMNLHTWCRSPLLMLASFCRIASFAHSQSACAR